MTYRMLALIAALAATTATPAMAQFYTRQTGPGGAIITTPYGSQSVVTTPFGGGTYYAPPPPPAPNPYESPLQNWQHPFQPSWQR